jgi:hypothetical protein
VIPDVGARRRIFRLLPFTAPRDYSINPSRLAGQLGISGLQVLEHLGGRTRGLCGVEKLGDQRVARLDLE